MDFIIIKICTTFCISFTLDDDKIVGMFLTIELILVIYSACISISFSINILGKLDKY